jgi:hypothetical protein
MVEGNTAGNTNPLEGGTQQHFSDAVFSGNRPYLFPKFFLALLPGLYGWQVYGWLAGLGAYLFVYLGLAGLAWAFVLKDWTYRRVILCRTALVLLSMVLIGVSAAQICEPNTACRWMFWAN